MKVKEESEKAGLKLNIQKTKIMASGLITSWEIHWETRGLLRGFLELRRPWGFSHEARRGSQGASRAAPGPMNHSMPGLPVHHQLPEFTQTHVH